MGALDSMVSSPGPSTDPQDVVLRASCQAVFTRRRFHLHTGILLILLRQLAATPQEAVLAVHAGAERPGVGRGRGHTGSFLPGTYLSWRQIWPATPLIAQSTP